MCLYNQGKNKSFYIPCYNNFYLIIYIILKTKAILQMLQGPYWGVERRLALAIINLERKTVSLCVVWVEASGF